RDRRAGLGVAARLLQLLELEDLDLDLGVLALAIPRLLLLRLLLLATDLLKRLLHVRVEARTIAEVGIENMFHAISCLGPVIVSKPGRRHCRPAVVLADYFATRQEKFPSRAIATVRS